MHALHLPDKGKHGGGMGAYAGQLAKSNGYITQMTQAAKVFTQVKTSKTEDLMDKAKHLAAIHKLPEEAWGVDLELGNKKDLLEIGKAKRVETLKQNAAVLSENDKTASPPPINTQKEIAKAAGVSTGQVGVGGRPKQRQEPEPVEPQQKIVAVSRPYYEVQAKERMVANGGDKTAEVQKIAPAEKAKARDEAGKAVRRD